MASISIHVPAWGTTIRVLASKPVPVFQSTFPRGERLSEMVGGAWENNFNPRSRVGNDGSYPDASGEPPISIHVPAWGTTFRVTWKPSFIENFNPRSRVGNDKIQHAVMVIGCGYFNPRSRVGNDSGENTSIVYKASSIHVPAWGTTGYNT